MEDKKSESKYYIGLDCGTSSVGWAVTDQKYNLLRAKGKTMWGSRLFEEADTAASRRLIRGTRRRNDRADGRLKLLRMLFCDEMSRIDKDFYRRLDESFYVLEDKQGITDISSDTLFNDLDFKDKDFHKKYPTIWHLRHAIVCAGPNEHFDLRFYFLAIQHIFKHRGHFLFEGELKGNAGDFNELYNDFYNAASNAGFTIRDDVADRVHKIICDKFKRKRDKKRELKELLVDSDEQDKMREFDEEDSKDYLALAGLLVGSSVKLGEIFALEDKEKFDLCFAKDVFEDRISDIEQFLGDDSYVDVILAAKRIYDYVVLKGLLKDSSYISEAMVKNYELHKSDLKTLKKLLKPFPDDYTAFFKTNKVSNPKEICYGMYVGKAYTESKNGRRSSCTVNQPDLNAYIKKLIEKHNIDLSPNPDFQIRLENGELLPKQRGQAKGTIPQQLHHNELEKIVEKLEQDFPSFSAKNPNENEKYNTKAKKLLSIHSFRRPYYCGPLVTKEKSEFSWADEEIKQIVYPWNFYDEDLVNLDDRADAFITRMTNDCTYLLGEKVLPKASLLYQKYMVLNEINNLKINGRRLSDKSLKARIYQAFENGEFTGNLTARQLQKKLQAKEIIGQDDEISGTAEHKTLPKLSTHQDFKRILGDDYAKKYSSAQLEEIIKAITILGNEKSMLQKKIIKLLSCSGEEAAKLSKLSYKDWGNFSAKFLTRVKSTIGTREMSILEALDETGENLMELLSSKYNFKKAIDDFNSIRKPQNQEITYENVKALYCSPAVKRSVWQAVRIVKEITDIRGYAPDKIFLESTREQSKLENKGVSLARKRKLQEKYSAIKSPETKELLNELDSHEDRDFQNKKLFLYFQQMGKCAYCGKPLNIEDLSSNSYDIDHIYPQSLTKDDSLEKNKVLVCAEHNRIKSNRYPIDAEIRNKMQGIWRLWRTKGLISEEKYNRLTRCTPLTDEELGEFIARQVIETSQTVKAIRDLFRQAYPKTKVVLVKAGQVSDLRHFYGYDRKDREGRVIREGNPEFIKLRALNDLHHAKDAYLNIVVGNTMSLTFTDNPTQWIKKEHPGEQKNYSIKTGLLFRRKEYYPSKKLGRDINWPVMKGWDYDESFNIVSRTMKRNDVLWTRMTYENSGQMSDLQIVGKMPKGYKSETQDGMIPIKNNGRLAKTAVYGGYNSASIAYFVLIEQDTNKVVERRLVPIPIIYKQEQEEFIKHIYPGATIIIKKIPIKSLLICNGIRTTLAGKSGDRVVLHPAMQALLSYDLVKYAKMVDGVYEKIDSVSKKDADYTSDMARIGINANDNNRLAIALFDKVVNLYKNAPRYSKRVEISQQKDKFNALNISEQCIVLKGLMQLLSCNAESGDKNLKPLISGTAGLSQLMLSCKISGQEIILVKQSATGLLEHKIDLNKVEQHVLAGGRN